MLLTASPHPQDAYDALSTASALHTPQQLAQLEAVARAQARETPESSLVPEDEKYLAAQLVYLASQYHASEYNRQKQKANAPQTQPMYIPLSIQLPTHIAELRADQAKSAERKAWFMGEDGRPEENGEALKEEPNDVPNEPGVESSGQAVPDQTPATGAPTDTVHFEQTPPPYPLRPSYFQPEIVQVDLLHDALGNSLFSTSTKLPPLRLSLLGTKPPALDPDIVETPPPLKEADLPRFPDRLVPPSPLDGTTQQSPSSASVPRPSPSSLLRPLLPTRPAPVHVAPSPTPQLQLALETAISKDTLPVQTPPGSIPPSPGLGPRIMRPTIPKTSESHPIKYEFLPRRLRVLLMMNSISQVIPPDYIGAISAQLAPRFRPQGQSSSAQGTYFRINPTFSLDRVIYVLTVRAMEARAAMAKYSPVPVRVRFGEGSMSGPAVFMGPGVKSEPSVSRPLGLTPLVTGGDALGLSLGSQGNELPPPADTSAPSLVPPITCNDSHPRIKLPAPITLPTLSLPPPPDAAPHPPNLNHPPPAPNANPNRPVLGNLYLSSCPGKKVRLHEPIDIKGRGAICRDLKADLQRVKQTGVFLVICCLDDDELEFLGAPWKEYQMYAREVGLDVLRLPMPEGLCPLSVQTMSEHMDQIIRNYTLGGKHVLAHCRGGVGRAGLVACAWMLKLGICGRPQLKPDMTAQQTTIQDPADTVQKTNVRESVIRDPTTQTPPEHLMRERKVPRDSMELLERVVYIIRRQRSVKAIETYEQVRFLLEFIEYLRDLDAKSESQGGGLSVP
ncbi:unnamed protein product [Rhizoctonia solani]|uniref:Tyrosine specific protein phosphatases domain-containing protein n=1 Tax=Rhizoctonia solani TaxID=456999 RepID=A0A8H3HFK4_9AGAM|nr:unnamed protein product [Rhizoctonia solani]